MTTTQAQAQSLYAQVLDYQDALVRRGTLTRPAHDVIADDSYETVVETTVVHCTCGEWIVAPNRESEFAYAMHVADALRLKLNLRRAA
jgi:hypothetical protein